MNKVTRIILIFLGAIFLTFIFLSQTEFLKRYYNISTANEPNLKINSYIFVTNLTSPKTGDFICFKSRGTILGDEIIVMRMCAKANDTIEMKNAIFYVNNKDFDKDINLVHSYIINTESLEKIDKNDVVYMEEAKQNSDSTYFVNLDKESALKYNLWDKLFLHKKVENQTIKMYWENITLDNFGPMVVPENKIFILGDNRHNSIDSRIIGFVDEEDIVGVVKFKLKF